jgi:hypothetical protein
MPFVASGTTRLGLFLITHGLIASDRVYYMNVQCVGLGILSKLSIGVHYCMFTAFKHYTLNAWHPPQLGAFITRRTCLHN